MDVESSISNRSLLADRVFVGVRVRPQNRDDEQFAICAEALEDGSSLEARRDERKGGAYLRSQQAFATRYAFDASFGPGATQADVFDRTTRQDIASVVEGRLSSLSVVAYGATGAGKTHTMMGRSSSSELGIIPRVVSELFSQLAARGYGKKQGFGGGRVQVSYLEVYNERVYDLLEVEGGERGKALRVCEDEKNGVVKVLNLAECVVEDAAGVLELLRRGNARRTTEATGANDASSRSHAVLQISTPQLGGNSIGRISLVDLAGSERASATGNRGARLQEGAHINKSLLALANCINALTDATAPKPKFRDSKLTLLLKTSLESDKVRLVILACLSPSMSSVDDTLNTLKYAYRAKQLKQALEVASSSSSLPPPPTTAPAPDDQQARAAPPRRRRASIAEGGPKANQVAPEPAKRTRRASVLTRPATAPTKKSTPPLLELRKESSSAVAHARALAKAEFERLAQTHARIKTRQRTKHEELEELEEEEEEEEAAGVVLLSPVNESGSSSEFEISPLMPPDVEPSPARVAPTPAVQPLLPLPSPGGKAPAVLPPPSPGGKENNKSADDVIARLKRCSDKLRTNNNNGACLLAEPSKQVVEEVFVDAMAGVFIEEVPPCTPKDIERPTEEEEAAPAADLERALTAQYAAEEAAERWKTAAHEAREHAESLAASIRACVESADDVGALKNRWDHGLREDVDAARRRWVRAIIADDTSTSSLKRATHILEDPTANKRTRA